MKNYFDKTIHLQVSELIKRSVEYAFQNYPLIPDYVRTHAQEMEDDVMRQHIELYVNKFSLDLGDAGISAIENLRTVFFKSLHS